MKNGAGILPLAATTGRVLLGERAAPCSEPGSWAGFGGGAEPDDASAEETALREFVEETGYTGPIRLAGHYACGNGGVSTQLFVGIVPDEFEPELNWEHSMALWLDPATLNQAALHWTTRKFFGRRSIALAVLEHALVNGL
jgi:8-oxo-dGTP pyrophosphatase MutT (NUDIX family)